MKVERNQACFRLPRRILSSLFVAKIVKVERNQACFRLPRRILSSLFVAKIVKVEKIHRFKVSETALGLCLYLNITANNMATINAYAANMYHMLLQSPTV